MVFRECTKPLKLCVKYYVDRCVLGAEIYIPQIFKSVKGTDSVFKIQALLIFNCVIVMKVA